MSQVAFFRQLFEYNNKNNLMFLSALTSNSTALEEGMKLISHIAGAQQIWFRRLQDETFSSPPLWDTYDAEKVKQTLEENHKNWLSFLEDRTDADLEKGYNYLDGKGRPHTDRLMDIMFHVINHSTHHRAQISTLIRQSGNTPPINDYIHYVRQLREG
jgi:uncharacterized damage-inducible protein DinB